MWIKQIKLYVIERVQNQLVTRRNIPFERKDIPDENKQELWGTENVQKTWFCQKK